MVDPVSLASSRFRLGDVVAAGGMGRIHRAHDALSGEVVAVKVLSDDDAEARARFVRECRALAAATHPGIVRYVAHGQLDDGAPYLAMEWLEGIDLRTRLARTNDPLSIREVLVLGRRIAAALGSLHAVGLVHRDVKPANLFLPDGLVERAKLLDLGVARHGAIRDVTGTGVLVGTPWYMAPEQARSDREIGPPTDVFALGVVLYQCITGTSPFQADHVVAGLAKILLEDPPPPTELAPNVPRALSDRVMQMLRKDPTARPADGASAAHLLEDIEVETGERTVGGRVPDPPASGARRIGIGEGEIRVACLLVARGEHAHGELVSTAQLPATFASLARDLLVLADGSLVLRPGESLLPRDQAERAARAALALRAVSPSLRIALTMGRASGARGPVGDVVDRAARALEVAVPGSIQLDGLVTSLLTHRFEIENGTLVGERAAEVERTLLGKPTVLVGRRRELALLEATLAEVVEEGVARAILVTGQAGMGKSRLLRELGRSLAASPRAPFVLEARGDAAAGGSPYSLLAPALHRAARIVATDDDHARRDKIAALARVASDPAPVALFLAELAGVAQDAHAHPALAAARADAALLAERMRGAFVAWARGVTETRALVLVLDDLHWGDLPSVRVVEAAIAALPDRPLLVLALARPEVRSVFPELFASHGATALQLDALTPKASAELVKQALGVIPDATLQAIVQRSSGNAFHLEELIRATAEGDGALPDTLVATLQARVLALSPEARRLLRAASVLGESCTIDAVEALLDASSLAYRVEDWLGDLVHRELLGVSGRELRFRHALVRDAVYAMLTDEDRALGHALAAAHLESLGERDALLLAGHHLAAGQRDRASHFLVEAAARALEGNDVDAAVRHAEHALREGASGELAGRAHGVAAQAAYWKSDYAASVAHGTAALAGLRSGSRAWLVAAGATLVSLARLGRPRPFDVLFAQLREVDADEDARAEHIVALCRGTFQPIFRARFADADRTLVRIAALRDASPQLDPGTLAQSHHVTGVRAAMVGDVGTFLVELSRAVEAFERAGDLRNVLLEKTTLGWCWAELGDATRAVEMIEANLARCEEARVPQAITYAKVNLGYALAMAGRNAEAGAMLRVAIEECRAVANARLEGWARGHLATLALEAGRASEAREEAARASALLVASPALATWALAVEARACAAMGDAAAGLVLADRAMASLHELTGLLQGESWPPLARAECLVALGRPEAAAAREEACARLRARVARLAEPAWRTSFLMRADSRATLALCP